MDRKPFDGRCALVCAASKGLGKASAMALARDGAAVAICARGRETLDAAAHEIASATGAKVLPIAADVARGDEVARLVREAAAALGGLDILVTNTGGPRSAPFEAIPDDEWRAAVDSLLMSVVRLCREAIPHMRARGGGRIINVTSVSAKQPVDGLVLSNSVRAAVTGLAKTLAIELAPHRITVNCVAPGFTATDRLLELNAAAAARDGISVEEAHRRVEERIPMKRMGTPEEFAAAVSFLASSQASYVTGVTLQVDGGFIRGLL
jgi:3-oxoacyl-[acyl-carrier protein] reductase